MKKLRFLLIFFFVFFFWENHIIFTAQVAKIGGPYDGQYFDNGYTADMCANNGGVSATTICIYKNGIFDFSFSTPNGSSNVFYRSRANRYQIVYSIDRTKALYFGSTYYSGYDSSQLALLIDFANKTGTSLYSYVNKDSQYIDFMQEGFTHSLATNNCYSYIDFSLTTCTPITNGRAQQSLITNRRYQPFLANNSTQLHIISIGKGTQYPSTDLVTPTHSILVNGVWYHGQHDTTIPLTSPMSFVQGNTINPQINTNEGVWDFNSEQIILRDENILWLDYPKAIKIKKNDENFVSGFNYTTGGIDNLDNYYYTDESNNLYSVLYNGIIGDISNLEGGNSGGNSNIKCDEGSEKTIEYTGSAFAPIISQNYNCTSINTTRSECVFDLIDSKVGNLIGTGAITNILTTDIENIQNLFNAEGLTSKITLPFWNGENAIYITLPPGIYAGIVQYIKDGKDISNFSLLDSWVYRVSKNWNSTWINNFGLSDSYIFYPNRWYNMSLEESSQGFKLLFRNDGLSKNTEEYYFGLLANLGDGNYNRNCCTSDGITYCDGRVLECGIDDDECLKEVNKNIDDENNKTIIDNGYSNVGTSPNSSGSVIEECNIYSYGSEAYRTCINNSIGLNYGGFYQIEDLFKNKDEIQPKEIDLGIITQYKVTDTESQKIFGAFQSYDTGLPLKEIFLGILFFVAFILGISFIFKDRRNENNS